MNCLQNLHTSIFLGNNSMAVSENGSSNKAQINSISFPEKFKAACFYTIGKYFFLVYFFW